MIKFIGLSKLKATRKAVDFWYKNFKDDIYLKDFLLCCTWKKEGKDYIVIYRRSFL